MNQQFWTFLCQYPSIQGWKKLKILKDKYLNNDQNIKYIHITGSNGKGSVARYLHAILSSYSSNKVGLFTSPHIIIVNERVVVSGEMISDQDLLRLKDLIANDVEKYQLGFFDILTLIALIYFQEQQVQWAIIEVGIGGKYDSTNIIKSDYVVITSITKDHVELLGGRLSLILEQKLGVVKDTTNSIFISGNLNQRLKKQVKNTITNTNVIYSRRLSNTSYYTQNKNLVKTIVTTILPDLEVSLICKIMKETKIALRFEKFVVEGKIIYFDVAHNLAAIKALTLLLKLRGVTIDKVLFSALVTKTPNTLIKELRSKVTNNLTICQNSHPRSISGEYFDLQKMIFDSSESSILVTGSCYFAADVYNSLIKGGRR